MTARERFHWGLVLLVVLFPVMLALALGAWLSAEAEGAELVPSVGVTRTIDSDETKSMIGIALRGGLLPPVLQSEIAVGYRREELLGGELEQKMWPVTLSALVSPLPTLHADAGVGWYHTTLDYESPLLEDETDQEFGVHAGGGFKVPLAPPVALDLTGRYVWLKEQESKLIPTKFDPDFWTLSLGLALRL